MKSRARRRTATTLNRTSRRITAIGFVVYFLSASSSILANDDAASVAAELANPNTVLGQMNFPIDYVSYKGDIPGADNEESWRLSFQPVLPYPLAEGVNLFVRPLIPILYEQPVPIVSGGDTSPSDPDDFGKAGASTNSNFFDSDVELGDISFDIAIGKTLPSKTILLGGMVGTLDTATDDNVGLGQTLLGPEIAIAQLFDWGVAGILISHQWDVAGDSDFDTSITGGQYFYAYNLSNGWQIQAQPTFSYNHEALSGEEKWTLPAGVGLTKVTRIGKTPWKFNVQYWHYVKQADAIGPDFQIRFQLGPVVPLPW